MNTIEDRLREALRERAAQSPVDPDAWARTVARVRRPGPARAWSRIAIPLAAAAAVVAIVAGATVLTRGGSGGTGTSASPSPSLVSGAPAPPGPGNSLIKGTTVVSAIIPIKLTAGKQAIWTFVWFSRPDSGSDRSIQLCSVTDGGGYFGSGGCGSPGQQAQDGFVEGTSTIKLIVSARQVTSVMAQLPDGRSVAGLSAWGRGFPDKVWLVNYPVEDHATIVMGDAAGQVVKRLSITGTYPFPRQPHSGGIKLFSYPAGLVSAKAGSVTAYLLNGSLVGIKGKVVGFWSTDNSIAVGNTTASGPPAVENLGGNWMGGAKVAEFFGYAHANVVRVELRLPDGRQYSAPTTAAWPGSGLRLWHFAVPVSAALFEPRQQVILGYGTAGQVVFDKLLDADY